jgi:superfamily II RNA helicase
MVTNALKKMCNAARSPHRWLMIAQALDLISEAYETQTAIPATAMLTPDGIFIEIELDELVVELLEPEDINELSPKAYAMLRRAKAFEAKDTTLTKELK